jgi:hypothetical protein
MRTAVAPGFRRLFARRGGRAAAVLVGLVLVGQAGIASFATASTRTAPILPSIAVAPGQLDAPTDAAAPGRAVDLAAFDATSVATDPAAIAADLPGVPDPADATGDPAGLQPSIQYEEAEQHANDHIAFTPGGRVTIGFQPRASDHWTVGGVGPTTLPAGRLDGAAIRSQGGPSTTRAGSAASEGSAR